MQFWQKIICCGFLMASLVMAQGLQDWQVITYMNDVTGITHLGSETWVATTGGVYRFNEQENNVERFTNLSGLVSLKITAIAADEKYRRILAGSEDGVIHICLAESDLWKPYFELQGQRIADIYVNADTVWIASDKGIGVFLNNSQGLEFRDFYSNLPVVPEAGRAITVFQNRVFYASDKGILYANSDFVKHNLKIAQAWKQISVASGLPADDVRALASAPDSLYIGTILGPVWLDEDFSIQTIEGWASGSVFNIVRSPSALYFANDRSYYRSSGTSWVYQNTFPNFINSLSIDDQENVWIGIRDNGLQKESWEDPLLIEGPASNHVGNLTKDSRGRLWMASGKLKLYFSYGFYCYDNGQWTNYYFSANWARKNATEVVYEDVHGNIWIGAWGGGITMIRPDDTFDFYHAWPEEGALTISDMSGEKVLDFPGLPEEKRRCFVPANLTGSEYYTIITQFGEDRNQNFWVANYLAQQPEYLAAIEERTETGLSDCSEWMYFGDNIGMSSDEGQVTALVFEDFSETERVWMGTFGRGVLVLDHNNTIDNPADDILYRLTMTSDNLFSNVILSMARDPDGIIWIGTDAGLNSYQPDPSGTNRRVFKHVGELGPIENKINQIFVDNYNNKWFATDGGLSVLIADRSPWEAASWVHYTPQNSGLPDKIVNSVYVDPRSGAAYIGTESGLAIFNGPFSEYKDAMDALTSGPNPFIISGQARFVIKNLAFNSRVKIFNLKGELIRELTTENGAIQGSRAVWDGLDSRQTAVASGIYIFMAFNDEGMNGSGKIAVVRQ